MHCTEHGKPLTYPASMAGFNDTSEDDGLSQTQNALRTLRLLEGLPLDGNRPPKDPTVSLRRPDPGAIARWIAEQERLNSLEPEGQHPALRALIAER
ncbi:MAG: hypothetical protein RL026_2402 [Pseudomonadota bacterium]|jgi:hypothetical protein